MKLRALATALLIWAACWPSGLVAAEIQAGLAQVDITPPVGGQTTGYAGAPPTDGVHDPVTARVLVLKSAHTCVALVSCDLCVFNSAWLHEQAASIDVDRLLLMNTHTHAGPNLRQDDFPSADEPWRVTVEKRVLEAIESAQENMFDAYFAAASGQVPLGYNRLVREGDHAVTHFENPDRIPFGPVDPTVGVIRVTDEHSQVRAVLVVYACHPVVLGPRNRKISADYPGVMRDAVEAQLGEQTTCIFIQGAGGDINPLLMARGESRHDDFQPVQRMGELLATEVFRVLALLKETPGESQELLSSTSYIQVAHRFQPDEELTLGVTSLLVNRSIGVITMPGEPFHQYQLDFRGKAGLPHAFLFGYCCDGPYDWPQYLPDVASAARGGYGASDTTQVEVGAGERLVHAGLAQLFALKGRLKSAPQRHVFQDGSEP